MTPAAHLVPYRLLGTLHATTAEPSADGDADPPAFVRIKPADESITAGTAVAGFRRLHALGGGPDDPGRLTRLLGARQPPPTIERRLVAPGGPAGELRYGLGCTAPGHLDALERAEMS